MIIGIDASRFSSEASMGIEFYSQRIITEILRLSKKQVKKTRSEIEFVLYTPSKLDAHFPANEFHGFIERVIPFPRLWTQVRLSYEMLATPPDVLFIPSHVIPLYHPRKTITMIHDVAFKYLRGAYSPFQYNYLNFAAWFACKFAYRILTPTNAVKQDLVRFYDCDPKKIFVVPHGMDAPTAPEHFSENRKKEILMQFGIVPGMRYVLFIGRLETKKNLLRLLHSFAEFVKKHSDYKMLLCGKRGIGFKKIWQAMEDNGLWNKVLLPGYINEKEKYLLLKNCTIFALPSLQEGFGFPILEAFHYKKPLLTSDILAIREVAADAAVFINPYKEKEIADGLARLADDENLREKLAEAGLKQVKKFKWETSAKKTLKILLD